jgi:hypothetical protein
VLPILFFLFVLTAVLLKKTKKSYSKHIQFINILMMLLLIVELADSVSKYYKLKTEGNLIDNRFTVSKNYRSPNIADSLKPDIFFIVFDELASSNGLLKHIGKDNKKLDSILKQKDFFIAEHGRANYNMTMYSLSTTFNMEYLPKVGSPRSDHTKYYFSCFESLLNNSLTEVLKIENYSIQQIQNLTFSRRFENEKPYFNDFKTNHFFYKTLFGRIKRDIGWSLNFKKTKVDLVPAAYQAKDRLIKKQISAVKNSCNSKEGPKFVYAHFMLPHILYIYDSIGNVKGRRSFSTGADDYYQQLLYTNKLINELVDYIQTNNKKNTIIIIEGDHGYHATAKEHSNYYFENFNAFYFPDKNYKGLYDSITPLNTFRIILNKYFSANLPLLKDSSIYVQ